MKIRLILGTNAGNPSFILVCIKIRDDRSRCQQRAVPQMRFMHGACVHYPSSDSAANAAQDFPLPCLQADPDLHVAGGYRIERFDRGWERFRYCNMRCWPMSEMGQPLPRRPAPGPPDVGCCSNSGQTRARLDWSLSANRRHSHRSKTICHQASIDPTCA